MAACVVLRDTKHAVSFETHAACEACPTLAHSLASKCRYMHLSASRVPWSVWRALLKQRFDF